MTTTMSAGSRPARAVLGVYRKLREKPSGAKARVVVQFEVSIHRLRDERLPKGPQFASESLDADTASVSVFPKLTHYQSPAIYRSAPQA
jgi:hypothetical protein